MYLVYQFSANEDPSLLSQTLWRLKISHRIVVNDGRSELWVNHPSHQEPASQLVKMWLNDPQKLNKVEIDPNQPIPQSSSIVEQIKAAPATVGVLLAAVIVAFITQLGSDLSMVQYFTISPFSVFGGQIRFFSLQNVLAQGEYWRLLTPALIHFSVMHIVFNALWVWDVGRRLERMIGSLAWIVGVIVIAIFSNILQFEIDSNPLFGGLSGVVYGLIGFAWLLPILRKDWPVIVSKPLMIFFMVWLGIGYTQIPESLGLGSIANTAHTIGLFAGLALCLLYWVTTKHRPLRQ
ncbi:Rhomboid protease GlpG [Marinomonas spartinae]|uniref:rhomboid family intramembrane serine protease n=1 Tax=Marinomonas spartinae TaxID=1792290 RepID=UPI000808DAF1|nr:rhomboid family intramembrane serine protease [Marinomonas spartinae]SBS38137.1 Rhomboid protease GlpG [Marinomonas spartinae]